MHEAWNKYKELLRMCTHNGVLRWMQIHNFYKGLPRDAHTLINALVGGKLMKKNESEAYELLENMTSNNYLWPNERLPPPKKVVGIHEIDVISKLSARLILLT